MQVAPCRRAAVEDHSIFFTERWPRLLRSLYPIGGVVFDGERAAMTGAEVRDDHIGIKGVDARSAWDRVTGRLPNECPAGAHPGALTRCADLPVV